MLISGLLGSEVAEKVLLYLQNYQSGYARGISREFTIPVSEVLRQLQKFEREGLLASQVFGRTRVYTWNPRYYFLEEVRLLLKKTLEALPKEYIEEHFRNRTRPRRSGKPV
jgi:predicted transcriptional regulator